MVLVDGAGLVEGPHRSVTCLRLAGHPRPRRLDGLQPRDEWRRLESERQFDPRTFHGGRLAVECLALGAQFRDLLRQQVSLLHVRQRRLGLRSGRGRRRQAGARILQRRLAGGDRFRRGVGVGGELAVDDAQVGLEGLAPALGQALHARIDVVTQQVLKDRSLVGGLGFQEPRELALRQHHRLDELVVAKTEQPRHGLVDGLHGVGKAALEPVGDLRQHGVGLEATRLEAPRPPDDAVIAAVDATVECHRHGVAAVRDELAEVALAHPRHLAVERVEHGVEDARLAGAGRAGNGEQRQ